MRRFFYAYKTYVKGENDNNFRVWGGGGEGYIFSCLPPYNMNF